MKEAGEVKKFSAAVIPKLHDDGNCISMEVLSAQGEGLTLKLLMVIFEQLMALLDLRNFDIPGLTLQLHQLDAPPGKLVIHAKTQIDKIPSLPT